MSHPKEKEAYHLMEEPQPVPVPGQVPDSQPPPYSNLFGSQYQAHTPVPPLPTNSPHPTQIPMTQDAAVYNPMSQVTMNEGRPFPQPGFYTTYAPTTYDPMANLPPVNVESPPDETLIDCEESAESEKKAKKGCCSKICSGIGMVFLVIVVVFLKLGSKSSFRRSIKSFIKTATNNHQE